MYPKFLNPAYTELFQLKDRTIEIPKCIIQFQKWKGLSFKHTFGNKPLVSVDDRPMFAEIAIVKHFVDSGWQARWIETYGRHNKEPICLAQWKDDSYANQTNEPIQNEKLLKMMHDISKCNNHSYAGCWDVLAWQGEEIVFAESKRNNKDSIRPNQNNWLAAGLSLGLTPDNFLLVQWDFNPRCVV